MSYVPQDQLDDEEQQRLLNGQAPVIQGTDVGAPGAGPGGRSGAGPTAGSFLSPQAAGTSGFTAVSDYLDANGPQSADLASKVGDSLTSEATGIQNDIGQAGTDFRGKVDTGAVRPDASLVNEAALDPTSVAGDDAKVASFAKMRDASYNGPQLIENDPAYSALQTRISEGKGAAAGVDTPSGRQALIHRTPGSHTGGMDTLDNLLLEQNPNARDTIATAAKPFGDLTAMLDQATQGADAYATQGKTDTDAAKQLVADKFTGPQGVIPGFQQDLTGRTSAAETGRQDFNTELQDILDRLGGTLPSGKTGGIQPLTIQELNDLKIPSSAIDQYANANEILGGYGDQIGPISRLLLGGTPANNPATADAVASSGDYSKAAALEKLMGGPLSFIHQADAAKAGTWQRGGSMPTLDTQAANALITKVNDHDKATADQFIAQNFPYLLDPKLNDPSQAYQRMLNLVLTDPSIGQGGLLGGTQLLSALNRLVNGFGAPDLNFTPVTPPPFQLQPTNPPPPPPGGGHHAF